MRESIRRALSVVMVVAVVGAGTVAWVNLDQGPDPVDQYGAVQEGDAVIATSTAIGLTLAATATVGLACVEEVVICQGDTKAVKKAEKRETKIELSSRAATAAQQAKVFLDSMNNSLEGAKMVARSEGEQAYYNAIQNDSSLAAARAAAKRAVRDFYYVKMTQVAASWNMMAKSLLQYESIEGKSGLPGGYVQFNYKGVKQTGNVSVMAPNGKAVETIELSFGGDTSSDGIYAMTKSHSGQHAYQGVVFKVGAINSTFTTATGPKIGRYWNLTQKINSDSAEVVQAMETLANQTYQKAISGELNTSEYLSANTLAREFSQQGNDQAWAAIRLSQIEDVGLPENLNNIGTVTVTSDGTTTTGVFLSKSNPASGQFEAGKTYNATKLLGEQMLVKESGSYATLSGQFTIEQITTPDGSTKGSLTIRNPDYQTTNMTQWKQQIEALKELRADINARQQKLMNDSGGGGGGLFNFGGLAGSLPFGGAGVLAALGAIVILGLVTRN